LKRAAGCFGGGKTKGPRGRLGTACDAVDDPVQKAKAIAARDELRGYGESCALESG